MKAFRIVPIPGFCLSGIHRSNTKILITKVERPIDQSVRFEIPRANTVYGPTPAPLVIRRLSPRPNKNSPNTKNKKVNGLGFRLKESSELQTTLGIFLIVKVSEKSFIDCCRSKKL
jgi:hypothetical protein